MIDISGVGVQILLRASQTYPIGLPIPITAFPDDTDPFEMPDIEIAQAEMGLNGDLITWAKGNPIEINISLLPGTPEDLALLVLGEQNRVGKGKRTVNDIIQLVRVLPGVGQPKLILTGGRMVRMPGGTGVQSSGRKKTNTYGFKFENKTGF